MTTPRDPASTVIGADLLRAYHATDYRADAEPPFVLRIGEPSAALAALHARLGVGGSAFLTACNPRSIPLSETDNRRRQELLQDDLEEAGYAFLHGTGFDPQGHWPAEPSFLVLGIGREAAITLGRVHEQNALLWMGTSATPELVLLR